jgi:signal transduction histidine kinase/CheY-like chemotaxis protein
MSPDTEASPMHGSTRDPDSLWDCLEQSGLGVWKWDYESNSLDCSRSCLALLAIADEEKPNLASFLSRLHPADREKLQETLDHAKDCPDPGGFSLEIRISGPDETLRWMLIRGRSLQPREKSLMGTLLDVSAQKESEELLKQQCAELRRELQESLAREQAAIAREQLFRQAVVLSRVLVYIVDIETHEVQRLSGLEAILGQGSETISHYDEYHRRIHPDDVGKPLANLKRIQESDCESYESEYRILNNLDQYIYVWDRGVVLRDASGKARQVMGATVDIDARRRSEEKYKEAVLQLEEVDRRKNEFIAILSHELRNPLTPLTAGMAILKNALAIPGTSERLTQTLQQMDRQVTHMSRLIDDLLDISRITRGRILLHEEHLDLRELVGNTALDYRLMIVTKGVAFQVDLPEDSLWVRGDSTRLAQAVGNLLHNASKFTPAGGSITLELQRDQDFAMVRIKDNGVGIEKDFLPRIFESFVQGDQSLERSYGGLGLGLSITRTIVDMHQGEVYARSEGRGTGAEFGIRLPLITAEPQSRPAKVQEAKDTKRRKILIVEDDLFNADMMSLLLRDTLGHEVLVAHDVLSALRIAEACQPEVVICDIGLPGPMNGYDFAQAFRAIPGNAGRLLIALTGYATEEDKEKALQAGFDHHMAKPPRLSLLIDLLAT